MTVVLYIVLLCLSCLRYFAIDSENTNVAELTVPLKFSDREDAEIVYLRFSPHETNLHNEVNIFCTSHSVAKDDCDKIFEVVLNSQIDYLSKRSIDDQLESCEGSCLVSTQFIANPHLKRTNIALSSEIKSKFKSTADVETFEREESSAYQDLLIHLTANNNSRLFQLAFIHSCGIEGEGNAILSELINLIVASGLLHHLKYVFVLNYGVSVGDEIRSLYRQYADKIIMIDVSADTSNFEAPTLRILQRIAQHINRTDKESYLLYLHTKGVSYSADYPQITDWRHLMTYFLVEKHQACYHLLASGQFDAVGVNYKSLPRDFRGNFWWSTGRFVSTLPPLSLLHSGKYEAEQWLLNGSPHPVRIFSLHQSEVDHHFTPYPRMMYATETDSGGSSDIEVNGSADHDRECDGYCFALIASFHS